MKKDTEEKSMSGVSRKPEFRQVCVWPGTVVGDERKEFVASMLSEFGARVAYLEEVETLPDMGSDGQCVDGTGGRNDLFFAVHRDDIVKFAVPRLAYGIRWIEDVLSEANGGASIYPERVGQYRCWDPDGIATKEEA